MHDVQQLEKQLGYTFRDAGLPVQALTHRSRCNEDDGGEQGDYQRLEFLGDAVLGLLLAELLFDRFPGWDEGALSQFRARLAGQETLAERARLLGIGPFIRLGRGEELTSGREKDSILADVLESLLGALFLDGGIEASRRLVVQLFDDLASAPDSHRLWSDSKSHLQEYLSAHGCATPEYRCVDESGPPHDRVFSYEIAVDGAVIGSGQGKSKKTAQQAAAAAALTALRTAPGQSG